MVIWDPYKNEKLKKERGISFEDVKALLLANKFLDSMENPARPHQMIFILRIGDYTYVVPYIVDDQDNIILKTIYPSRKFHKIYKNL